MAANPATQGGLLGSAIGGGIGSLLLGPLGIVGGGLIGAAAGSSPEGQAWITSVLNSTGLADDESRAQALDGRTAAMGVGTLQKAGAVRAQGQADTALAKQVVQQGKADSYAADAKSWLTGEQSGNIAGEQARRGAADIGSQVSGQARSLGLNAAMAAKQGGQAGGNAYSGLYSNIFGSTYGKGADTLTGLSGQYNTSATNYGNQGMAAEAVGSNYLGGASQSYGTAAGQAQGAAGQSSAETGGILAAIGGMMGKSSDKNNKRMIKSGKDVLDVVSENVKPYRFQYKEGVANEDPNKENVGVMAQDLEKTPLAGNVMDTPNGKMIDTQSMTMANTAMISDLNEKLNKAMGLLKSANKYKKAG